MDNKSNGKIKRQSFTLFNKHEKWIEYKNCKGSENSEYAKLREKKAYMAFKIKKIQVVRDFRSLSLTCAVAENLTTKNSISNSCFSTYFYGKLQLRY